MPDDDDDALPGVPHPGVIWGIVQSERKRLDRHETWSGERFNTLDRKMDQLDTKVDARFEESAKSFREIKELLANQAGGRSMLNAISRPMFWAGGVTVTIGLWLLDHLNLLPHR